MKIAFTGAHGTGKTSVSNALAPRLHLEQAPSIQRQLKAEGFEINKEATMFDQLMMLTRKFLWESEHDDFVIDRHYYDLMAYTKYHVDYTWDAPTVEPYMAHYEQFAMHWTKYDYVFYFPIYWPLVGDGVRDTDIEYQDEIDSNIQYFMKEKYQGSFYTMPNTSVEKRADFIEGIVRQDHFILSDSLNISRNGSLTFRRDFS